MIRIFKLVLLLVVSQVAFGQAPTNYTNINGRYRWIAGMFDSTFHIPKGTTPSLRTGGSTNAGGLFYNTSDSSVYTYTGTQWIKLRGTITDTTSLSNRINLKLNISDTASMLSPYLRKVDTTNKFVTQVYKKNGSDSVFYVRGGNHLWAFNDSSGAAGGGGGGKIYYFNGGVSMGTFGGLTMYELGDTANTGAAANFTRATTGNIANFITDPGKPGLLQIPAGVWSVDAWLSETGGGSNHAEIWVEVEKWDGSTITTIATSPIEQITEGSTPNLYSWSVTIPTTSLAITDRIIIQFYISNTNGKTVTLYTQNGYVGEVHTTFTTGIGAINGLTAPAQYLVTGTSGTDFNISSVTATHTFNLPTASATNRGALSTADWTTFNSKIGGSGTTNYVSKFTGSGTIGNSNIFDNGTSVGVGTANPTGSGLEVYNDAVGGRLRLTRDAGTTRGALQFGRNNAGSFQESSRINATSDNAAATNGSMTFQTADGSGSLQINMTLESDGDVSVSNKLGVGTLTGDSALTVVNGARFQRGVRMSGLPTAVGTKSLRIDASGTLSIADTLANGVSGSGAATEVAFWNSTSSLSSSSNLYWDNVNSRLGINITPIYPLTVNGSVISYAENAYFWTKPSSPASDIYSLSANSSGAYIYNHTTTNTLAFFAEGGNVGIGTTNPAYKLDVAGSGRFGNTGNNTEAIVLLDANTTKTHIGSGFGATFIQNNVYYNGSAYAYDDNALPSSVITLSSGEFNVQTGAANTSPTTKLKLDNAGNLGLGVTPSAWGSNVTALQLPQAVSLYAWNASAVPQMYLGANNYFDGSNFKYQITGQAATYYYQGVGQHQWLNAASGTAGNTITFTQAMTLDASGNLGIGNISPTDRLDVTGVIISRVASGTGTLKINNSSVNKNWSIYPTTNGTQTDINFYEEGTAVTALTMKSGGNVGIGTTSPSSRLDVTSSGFNVANFNSTFGQMAISFSNNGTNIATLGSGVSVTPSAGANDVGIGTSGLNNAIVFATGTGFTERMRITSGGEVYIGNNPADAGDYKLQVSGNVYQTGNLHISKTDAAANLQIRIQQANRQYWDFLTDQNESLTLKPQNSTTGEVPAFRVQNSSGTNQFSINTNTSAAEFAGTIKTAAPTSGTAKPWKLGAVASVSPTSPDRTIEVEIDGTTYYIHAKTTNN